MHSKKIHLFSMTTPIRPGVTTYVDLGDTKHSQPSFTPEQAEQQDKLPKPAATNSQRTPIVDLRSLTVKRGESFHGCQLLLELVDVTDEKVPEITVTEKLLEETIIEVGAGDYSSMFLTIK